MAVQEVTKVSYGSRIASSFKGILVGIIMFIIAIPVLWLNEGRAVKTYKALKEGAKNVISVEANAVDGANEGKLIHISGNAATTDTLRDDKFGIQIVGIKLVREVEMYQWKENTSTETKKKVGGSEEKTTTYTYEKGWASSAISSANFKEQGHDNPGVMPFEQFETTAQNVTVGAFKLSDSQIRRISGAVPLNVREDQPLPNIPHITRMDNGFYISKNGASSFVAPEIGDVKVTFSLVSPHDISICSVQTGNTFKPYTAKNGKSIDLLSSGIKTADEMFESAQKANVLVTWILRFVGFFLMYAGISAVLAPLSVLADVVPFIGNIVGAGTKAISFLVALPISLLVIALAWIFYRPLLGIALLVIVVVCVVLVIKKLLAAKAAKAAAPAQA
ncbi:MAG: TMEM43 family protein [Victivallales bacterium]|nr:TMEM43 family protein [Victivallales bacterium]